MVRRHGMGDDATASTTAAMVMQPVAVVSPPFAVPSGAMPPTPAPTTVAAGLGQYVLWGGLAYLAYSLLPKR